MRSGQVSIFLASFSVSAFAPALVFAADSAEKQGGVPQLDPTYYPSQLFWLIICFTLMYVLLSKVALPPVERMMDRRDDKVRIDLESAHRARTETEEVESLYNRSLRDADEEARTCINKIVEKAKTEHDKALKEAQSRLSDKISETEQFLLGEKNSMLKDVPAMAERLSGTILGELKKAR